MQVIISKDEYGFIALRHPPCNSLLAFLDPKTLATGYGAFMLYCYTCGEHSICLQGIRNLNEKIKDKIQAETFEPFEIEVI